MLRWIPESLVKISRMVARPAGRKRSLILYGVSVRQKEPIQAAPIAQIIVVRKFSSAKSNKRAFEQCDYQVCPSSSDLFGGFAAQKRRPLKLLNQRLAQRQTQKLNQKTDSKAKSKGESKAVVKSTPAFDHLSAEKF